MKSLGGCCKIPPAVPFRVIFLRKITSFRRKTYRKSTGIRILQHPHRNLSALFCGVFLRENWGKFLTAFWFGLPGRRIFLSGFSFYQQAPFGAITVEPFRVPLQRAVSLRFTALSSCCCLAAYGYTAVCYCSCSCSICRYSLVISKEVTMPRPGRTR